MPIELTAHTDTGARLVSIAEELAEQLAVRAAEHDREGTYPFEAIDALKAAGYFAAPIPIELGGLGVSSAHDLVVAASRLARGDASVAIGVNMHLVAVLNMVRRHDVAAAAGPERRARAFAGYSSRSSAMAWCWPPRSASGGRISRARARSRPAWSPAGGLTVARCSARCLRGHRPVRGRHLRRPGRRRALCVRDGRHRRARSDHPRRLGRDGDARFRQQLRVAGGRRAPRVRRPGRLPRRRSRREIHGAQPRGRTVPRLGLARHRRVR